MSKNNQKMTLAEAAKAVTASHEQAIDDKIDQAAASAATVAINDPAIDQIAQLQKQMSQLLDQLGQLNEENKLLRARTEAQGEAVSSTGKPYAMAEGRDKDGNVIWYLSMPSTVVLSASGEVDRVLMGQGKFSKVVRFDANQREAFRQWSQAIIGGSLASQVSYQGVNVTLFERLKMEARPYAKATAKADKAEEAKLSI